MRRQKHGDGLEDGLLRRGREPVSFAGQQLLPMFDVQLGQTFGQAMSVGYGNDRVGVAMNDECGRE